MERRWYLSRGGKVFGPVSDAKLVRAAVAGRILPTDQLNIAGGPFWIPAADILALLSAARTQLEPEPELELEPAESEPAEREQPKVEQVATTITIRTTCMACFSEVSVEVMPNATSAHCPLCRSAMEISVPSDSTSAALNEEEFAKLENDRDHQNRMEKKAADAWNVARDKRTGRSGRYFLPNRAGLKSASERLAGDFTFSYK